MRWLLDHVDLVGILIASIAIGVSFATVVLGRRQRRQDIFLRTHEMLVDIEVQRGRRLLYEYARKGFVPEIGHPDWDLMNRALAIHNTVAIYVRRGVVPKRWVLYSWHHALRDMRPGAMLIINKRQAVHGWRVWTELEMLFEMAARYRTSMPCCRSHHSEDGERVRSPSQTTPTRRTEPSAEIQAD